MWIQTIRYQLKKEKDIYTSWIRAGTILSRFRTLSFSNIVHHFFLNVTSANNVSRVLGKPGQQTFWKYLA